MGGGFGLGLLLGFLRYDSPIFAIGLANTSSLEPSMIPKEARDAVLNGDVTLKGIADYIAAGEARRIVVVCGTPFIMK
jgi:hypothetical protein